MHPEYHEYLPEINENEFEEQQRVTYPSKFKIISVYFTALRENTEGLA